MEVNSIPMPSYGELWRTTAMARTYPPGTVTISLIGLCGSGGFWSANEIAAERDIVETGNETLRSDLPAYKQTVRYSCARITPDIAVIRHSEAHMARSIDEATIPRCT